MDPVPDRSTGRRRAMRWIRALVITVVVAYAAGLSALLLTRSSYVGHARLYLTVEDSLVWQGRTGSGYRVWTAGIGPFELWQAYQWIPAIREARREWQEGRAAGTPDDRRH